MESRELLRGIARTVFISTVRVVQFVLTVFLSVIEFVLVLLESVIGLFFGLFLGVGMPPRWFSLAIVPIIKESNL
ncbi:hypothetical protein [Borrelia sp. RT1S]|uniref:hypothetical protein n=1 Tax=Borrelia sp. RT1S TaxID=2898580 RepID=UPI001E3198F1|nr:hypothetical protein [Borrelia sp. RT1S]UGQ17984.1 hypothetical protein LSO05_05990 [Borrelia sp. RT1S]